MIVLKVLVAIIVIEAIAIMVLGIARSAAEIKRLHKPYTHSNGVDKMFENVEEGFNMDLSGLQPWDPEHTPHFYTDKPDGGFSEIQNYIKSKEAEKNDRETKADN